VTGNPEKSSVNAVDPYWTDGHKADKFAPDLQARPGQGNDLAPVRWSRATAN